MSRRAGEQAEADVRREREARWKYVIRHPRFRKELRELRTYYRTKGAAVAEPTHKEFVEKWGLTEIPFDILTRPYIDDEIPLKNQFYESFCQSAPICPPAQVEAGPLGFTTPSGVHRGEFVTITVDLSYPDNLLVSVIEGELKAVRGDSPRRRHHRDKTDEYLDVYDRAEKGETFITMAAALNQSVPTLKSRLRAACRNIYGPENIPPKWKLKTIGLDEASHVEHCRQCQNASTVEEMCAQGQAYVNQDTAGRDELAGDEIIQQAPAPESTDDTSSD